MKHFLFIFSLTVLGFLKITAQTKLSDTAYINSKTVDKKVRRTGLNYEMKSGDNYLFRFKNADNIAFKEADYNDSSWEKRSASFDVEELEKENIGNSAAWFRLRLKADTSMLGEALAFNFTNVGAMEIYLDGVLKRKIGSIKDTGKSAYMEIDKQPVYITL